MQNDHCVWKQSSERTKGDQKCKNQLDEQLTMQNKASITVT